MADVVEQLTGLIPVVITGGIVTRLADQAFGKVRLPSKRKGKRSRRQIRGGNFQNVGW